MKKLTYIHAKPKARPEDQIREYIFCLNLDGTYSKLYIKDKGFPWALGSVPEQTFYRDPEYWEETVLTEEELFVILL
jgi:hypothetical protein